LGPGELEARCKTVWGRMEPIPALPTLWQLVEDAEAVM